MDERALTERLITYDTASLEGMRERFLGLGGNQTEVVSRNQLLGRLVVVELALIGDVVQRIDMGMAVAVARHAEEAHAEGEAALGDRDVVHQRH